MGSEGKSWLPRSGRQLSQGLCPWASLPADVGGKRGKKPQVASLSVLASGEGTFALVLSAGAGVSPAVLTLKGPPWEMYTKYRQWMSTLHCMASPWEKVDGKSEQRELLERVQKKMCENNQKNSMVFHWKKDGILLLDTGIGANLGYQWHHQCAGVRACTAMQWCQEQQTRGAQGWSTTQDLSLDPSSFTTPSYLLFYCLKVWYAASYLNIMNVFCRGDGESSAAS